MEFLNFAARQGFNEHVRVLEVKKSTAAAWLSYLSVSVITFTTFAASGSQ